MSRTIFLSSAFPCKIRKIVSYSIVTTIICLSLFLAGCDGSDDDNSNHNGSSDFVAVNDPCAVVGAKVANGEVCPVDQSSLNSSLVRLSFVRGNFATYCTGAVITSKAILTAAHCFIDNFEYIVVETATEQQEAQSYVLHPQFGVTDASGDRPILVNDIALVFVRNSLSDPKQPLLASREAIVGETAVIAGFGTTENDDTVGTLRAGSAAIENVTSQHLFLYYTDEQSHPCRGDSGGPVLINVGGTWAIGGIVSQSDPSVSQEEQCRVGDLTIYTNIQQPSVQSFIDNHTSGEIYR